MQPIPALTSSQISLWGQAEIRCEICGAVAHHRHFGVVSCDSCKIFFRRNAENRSKNIPCRFGELCQVTITGRHLCSACRLQKCFRMGMSTMFFRPSRIRKQSNREICQIPRHHRFVPQLNLLNETERTFLSNVVHCYDAYHASAITHRFILAQQNLPVKRRYKDGFVAQMLSLSFMGIENCFRSNEDFLSLNQHDQSILTEQTMEYIIGVCKIFALRQTKHLESSAISKTIEVIFGFRILELIRRLVECLTHDEIFVKLIIFIIMFSSIYCPSKIESIEKNFQDYHVISQFQNKYIELTYKYLLSKYDVKYAIRCFLDLIRLIFLLSQCITQSHQNQICVQTVKSLVRQTEQSLSL